MCSFKCLTPQRIITMSWMYIFLPIAWGAVVSSYTVVELYVRPGETVTVPCDCKLSSGETIVWYRNCSHENQPPLILTMQELEENKDSKLSNLSGMWNHSSKTSTLLITNISDTHLGLYYCRIEKQSRKEQDQNDTKYKHRCGNVTTRISFDISVGPTLKDIGFGDSAAPDCRQCWMLLVILCPSSALLLSLLSSFVVYLCCRRKDESLHVAQTPPSSRDITSIRNQDEDGLFYATLDIPLRSQRPKKKRVQPSEFSTYSAISTKRM
ncbi:uncharacterized protein LOC115540565 isoform X2 [Gadus morhua]|uniref:uncharacterized protein LOC115540565 isoform X2 n=1 Tax=Gadus morhua TaxID=8049 RepID=UPI0011B7A8EB|nr:uncharacterized protein LOC115540565 isoform X2 [Gadus morhua]